ncbi:alpha/beta fold hydrolase [Rhodococcus pyridinivorans]|uniref:Alpha/beta fold hydrolase n=1 Tax=Rhodococcus pyridinivorans TaxID=103816 RepID=A0A7M2XRV0_9NOCA|nr:alpha/beta fold hydrolase [Rhodococcus pyridinivorans]QOW00113.1 alpha/beta fold hydrolase [Rhodococcus pyridinivorans]WMM74012.1 alpha/beta fold hydrolase [Rhodococcus pyridinivorans]
MLRSPPTSFAESDEGRAFYAAYDALLAKWPRGTVIHDLDSRFGTTRVTEYGPPEAPPVLLLPGAGATSMVWFATAAALGEAHRVLAVDILGDVGRSVADGDPVRNVDDLLGWLGSVADALGATRCALVGHSYGAMIALAAAVRTPHRVDRLVLLDPNSCFAGMRPGYLLRALPVLLRPTAARERAFLGWEARGAQLDPGWITLMALGAEHFPTAKTIVPQRPSSEELGRYTAETTVVLAPFGRVHDPDKVARAARQALPSCRIVMLTAGTHHTLPMYPSDEIDTVLRDALGTGAPVDQNYDPDHR